MKEYLHEGTVIHTKIHYVLLRGKRQYTDQKPVVNKKRAIFEFEAFMYPPLMLLPTTWQRYGYTKEDVISTYDTMDASFVWQISLMLLCGTYEPEAASAGVRSTFQSPFTFLFISRKTVFDVFLSTQQSFVDMSSNHVLCKERPDHKPLLPKIRIPKNVFDSLRNLIPERHPSFIWTVIYPSVYKFKDVEMVPVSYDNTNSLIYMCRVIRKSVYDDINVKPSKCVITLPSYVVIKNEKYVMMEEACFFSILKPVGKRSNANLIEKVQDIRKRRRR